MIPIWLAPLRGVTTAPFRRVFSRFFGGVDFALAPFAAIGSGSSKIPLKLFSDVLADRGGALETVPQVIGKDPDGLREAGRILRDAGFSRLDLNCGCPWKFVAKKGRGSGLPEDPAAFERMVEAGCEAMPNGFSIKIRLGRTSTRTLLDRVPILNRYPLAMVTIHPRTGEQMYSGAVHLDAFAEALEALDAPVVYNGDIADAAGAAEIVRRFPKIRGLMIGRGLCARPWLAEDIRQTLACNDSPQRTTCSPLTRSPTADRRRTAAFARALAAEHAATLCGPAPLMGRLKELWGYLHAAFEGDGTAGLRAIQRAKTLDALVDAIDRLIDVTEKKEPEPGRARAENRDFSRSGQTRRRNRPCPGF